MSRVTLAANPFDVLGLPTDASAKDVERAAQKLLGMLEVGVGSAATFESPVGPQTRTPEAVRLAAAALRDPRVRLVAELTRSPSAPAPTPGSRPMLDVFAAFGWPWRG